MPGDSKSRRGFLIAATAAALASFVPFLRAFLRGESFYFRDLSGQFFPARRFLLDGLAQGEWRYWNPFLHEGVPAALSPFAYLPDLLQLLIPNEFGISLLLALHIPFAAVTFTLLARELGLPPVAAAASALVYALGGFSLSTINLYVYVQTIAWAPLFILAFRRAVETGGGRALALAALALAMMVSTTGLEIAIQACLLATLLTPPVSRSRFLRSAAGATLGLARTAAIFMPLLSVAGVSERASGFPTSVVLANSNHPMTFFQVLIAGFYGDISNLTGAWWGVNFFPRGFPYVLSLFLGPTVLALAFGGATVNRSLRRRLIVMAFLAAALSLGRYAAWDHLVDLSPSLRFLRYPVKAFFTVQFSIALLAGFAVAEIAAGARPAMRRIAFFLLGLGGALTATLLLPSLAPQLTAWFLHGFLPKGLPPEQYARIGRLMTSDAATSGLVALLAGAIAFLAGKGRLHPSRAAVAVVALAAADLIRAGAGLNASVTLDFYRLSPEMAREVEQIRQSGGRVFTCNPESSRGYWEGRRARAGNHEVFTMAAMQEALTPDFNVSFGVKTALSIDRTSLVPSSRVLSPELASCSDFGRIVEPLRRAGVNRVLSLDPLADPSLTLLGEAAPLRIAPVRIRVYELSGSQPRFNLPVTVVRDVPNTLSLVVDADRATTLIVRDPFAAGWRATVGGAPRPIARTSDGHRELSLPPGRNEVSMTYEPPGLRAGIAITLAAGLLCLGLLCMPSIKPAADRPAPFERVG